MDFSPLLSYLLLTIYAVPSLFLGKQQLTMDDVDDLHMYN